MESIFRFLYRIGYPAAATEWLRRRRLLTLLILAVLSWVLVIVLVVLGWHATILLAELLAPTQPPKVAQLAPFVPYAFFWQTGQKKVERPDWTIRATMPVQSGVGQGSPSRS